MKRLSGLGLPDQEVRRTGALGVLLALLCLAVAAPSWSAERIEWWRGTTKRIEGGAAPAEGADETGEATVEEEPNKAAEILEAAATRTGLPLAGEVAGAAASELAPPESGDATLPALPGHAAREQFGDYSVVSVAAAGYSHPKGQTLRVALFEFASSEDAWGLWSRGRGEKKVNAGTAAAYGDGVLRVWEGKFAAVLSMDPPEELRDEPRVTTFARGLFALVSGPSKPPRIVGWLPTAYQLTHTAAYYHAQAPRGSGSMALSEQTSGAMATYRIGEAGDYTGAIVSYPDTEAALAAWATFVQGELGKDPDSGARGTRRTNNVGDGWSGIKVKGQVCVFVFGAPTRNQAEQFLAQAAARASGT